MPRPASEGAGNPFQQTPATVNLNVLLPVYVPGTKRGEPEVVTVVANDHLSGAIGAAPSRYVAAVAEGSAVLDVVA